jgi:hypothetical protein
MLNAVILGGGKIDDRLERFYNGPSKALIEVAAAACAKWSTATGARFIATMPGRGWRAKPGRLRVHTLKGSQIADRWGMMT